MTDVAAKLAQARAEATLNIVRANQVTVVRDIVGMFGFVAITVGMWKLSGWLLDKKMGAPPNDR